MCLENNAGTKTAKSEIHPWKHKLGHQTIGIKAGSGSAGEIHRRSGRLGRTLAVKPKTRLNIFFLLLFEQILQAAWGSVRLPYQITSSLNTLARVIVKNR